jgi:hypothetical protein
MNRSVFASGVLCLALALATLPGRAATVIDEWSTVRVPTPPPLASVTVDPGTTALLVLDFVKQTCGGPRCTAAVPVVAKLLGRARSSKMLVVYSYIFGGTMADTLPPLAPLGGEPAVQGGPDKFLGSDLQQILSQKGHRQPRGDGGDEGCRSAGYHARRNSVRRAVRRLESCQRSADIGERHAHDERPVNLLARYGRGGVYFG